MEVGLLFFVTFLSNPKAMKILMTTDTRDDKWYFTLNLLSSLSYENVEVVLLAMGPKLFHHQLEELEELAPNIHFYHQSILPEWKENDLTSLPRASIWINKIFSAEKPDLIHLNHYSPACIHWDVPVVLSPHSCIVMQEMVKNQNDLTDNHQKVFHMTQIALHSANALVFPSVALLSYFTAIYGEMSNVFIIPPGLKQNFIPSDQKFPMVFSEGNLEDPYHQLDLLMDAASSINGEIFIAGEKEQIQRLPKNVRFLGKLTRQQKMNWLKMAAIYAWPSKNDPFGLGFLDAASQRCALVGGENPYLKEIWGEALEEVKDENPIDLADACNELLHFPHKAYARGENAFSKAQEFNQQSIARQYVELYEDLINNFGNSDPSEKFIKENHF
jgi:glycogen synthase